MNGPFDRNLTERMLIEHIAIVTGIIRERYPELYNLSSG